MVDFERITELNDKSENILDGRYVLYWMQASQRCEYNYALNYAIERANELGFPVVVCFGLMKGYPDAQERHYWFMLEGLNEVKQCLEDRGIAFCVKVGQPWQVAFEMSRKAVLVVCDRGYLSHQRKWRQQLAQACECRVVEIESDCVVPIGTASNKKEYAAGTIRNKIMKNIERFLVPFKQIEVEKDAAGLRIHGERIDRIARLLEKAEINTEVARVEAFAGGTSIAKHLLREFIDYRLEYYQDRRNDHGVDMQSQMSPYLHFGQISPVYIGLEVNKANSESAKAYLEELIVRRELSFNYVWFNESYDSWDGLPGWAKSTLSQHKNDKRKYAYDMETLEMAKSHDPYWNAAQMEMMATGKMHGYMRMYWGKKIIEWVDLPQRAFDLMVYLNNKYELDGRDPNSWTGVAWCFGNHDRAWAEREIFGKVRYMNSMGLERKFDIGEYVHRVEEICRHSKCYKP